MLTPCCILFASGMMTYVCISELLPAAYGEKGVSKFKVTCFFFLGCAVMASSIVIEKLASHGWSTQNSRHLSHSEHDGIRLNTNGSLETHVSRLLSSVLLGILVQDIVVGKGIAGRAFHYVSWWGHGCMMGRLVWELPYWGIIVFWSHIWEGELMLLLSQFEFCL